ncbi:flavin reductase (DIM6/NTAB) family NADH-FMN oxidoreductase RutF [Rhodoligotrophos appendicifer]|uniref:flavin reductase family protein n=1 Tax=Rhodoligotrophos appendicifer TaxID=987056 RepID=UPI001185AF1E|nr:flavin reductase family protein [Rhodoligotrophos appendicifer]
MIDDRELRNAFGAFVTGVTVVTTIDAEGRPRGFTANSFSSVSINPPLLLVCIAKAAASCASFIEGRGFAVNILAESQREASVLFASKRTDKFESVAWRQGPIGSPILDDVVGWFDCRNYARFDAGDHVILIGHVEDFGYSAAEPLGYIRGSYFTPSMEQDAIAAAARSGSMVVGALLDCSGRIVLLCDGRTGTYHLPEISVNGGSAGTSLLLAKLASMGLQATISFVFAVFESEKERKQLIYYRGAAAPEGVAVDCAFDRENVPWARIRDEATLSMIQRYFAEQDEGAFGVFSGHTTGGEVARLMTTPTGEKNQLGRR